MWQEVHWLLLQQAVTEEFMSFFLFNDPSKLTFKKNILSHISQWNGILFSGRSSDENYNLVFNFIFLLHISRWYEILFCEEFLIRTELLFSVEKKGQKIMKYVPWFFPAFGLGMVSPYQWFPPYSQTQWVNESFISEHPDTSWPILARPRSENHSSSEG